MKIIVITIACFLTAIASYSQQVVISLVRIAPIQHSASLYDYRHEYFMEHTADEGQCIKARKLKTAGIVLAISGGGLIVAGLTMLGLGVAGAGGEHTGANPGKGTNTAPVIIAGTVCGSIGFAGLMTGLPLAGIGAHRCHRYCNDEGRHGRSWAELQTIGNGLALNF